MTRQKISERNLQKFCFPTKNLVGTTKECLNVYFANKLTVQVSRLEKMDIKLKLWLQRARIFGRVDVIILESCPFFLKEATQLATSW